MISERIRFILEDLEETLLQFIRKHEITHEEYRCATDILVASVKAGEGSLLYDVFFEAAATDTGNIGTRGQPRGYRRSLLPAERAEARSALRVAPASRRSRGRAVFSRSRHVIRWRAVGRRRIRHVAGGRRGSLLEHTSQHYRSGTCADAFTQVTTEPSKSGQLFPHLMRSQRMVRPGSCLRSFGRHFFRPAHLHLKVSHPRYRSLTSLVYFDGGDYLNSDVANAVREDLVAKLVRREDSNDLAARGLDKPYFEVSLDFILVPHSPRA